MIGGKIIANQQYIAKRTIKDLIFRSKKAGVRRYNVILLENVDPFIIGTYICLLLFVAK